MHTISNVHFNKETQKQRNTESKKLLRAFFMLQFPVPRTMAAQAPSERSEEAKVDVMLSQHASSNAVPSLFVIRVTAIASLGGALFGYDMGSVAGALPQIQESFALSNSQAEWVVSILYLGGGFGAMIGGTLCDLFGRRKTILGTDIIFMVGALWLFLSNSYHQILLGRFVVGIAVAVSGIADVSYLHEIAPIDFRGAIVSANEACISLGFLLAYVAGYVYSSADQEEWRLIFGWAGVLALVQFIGMINLPESPVWLKSKGRIQESQLAWNTINGEQSDPLEHDANRSSNPEASESSFYSTEDREGTNGMEYHQDPTASYNIFQRIFSQIQSAAKIVSRYRRQAYISLFLSATQQFCGQANVLNYAPYIFAQATGDDGPPSWSLLAIGFVKFFATVVVIWKIEIAGRRTMLLAGMSMISIGLFALIIAFGGSSNDSDSWNKVKGFELALPGVLLVVCGYSMSFGPLQWLLTSELFPTEIRGRALGASTIVTYLCASIITRTFLSAQSVIGPSKVFAIYCLVNTIGIVFAYLAVPDTGGKTVEQIEVSLHQMWWWRYDAIALFQTEEEDCVVISSRSVHQEQQQAMSPRQQYETGMNTSRPELELT
jgi:MFS family permease